MIVIAAPATAAKDIPPPYEVRFIDRHGASSDCIGDPRTPLCAVETYLASGIRAGSWNCEDTFRTGRLNVPIGFPSHGNPRCVVAPVAAEYRIVRVQDFAALGEKLANDQSPGENNDLRNSALQDYLMSADLAVMLDVRYRDADNLVWPDAGRSSHDFLLKEDGAEWLVVGENWPGAPFKITRRGATSRCIGDIGTPVCAVETLLACHIRDQLALCRRARADPRVFFTDGVPQRDATNYFVKSIRRSTAVPAPTSGSLEVVVDLVESRPRRPPVVYPQTHEASIHDYVVVSYTLQRTQGEWRVAERKERP